MAIDRPGCYAMIAEEYHADPCPEPSLSSSIARLLLNASPLHAWHAHPRLGPAPREESDRFDLGTAAHAYALEGESGCILVDAPDWRAKAARDARAHARASGKVALLAHRWAEVVEMVHAMRQQLAEFGEPPPPLAGGGHAEQTLIWRELGCWCRARLDWLHPDHRTVDDLKTRGESANPDVFIRGALYREGYDVQAAFYARGVKAVFGVDATVRFVVVEQAPPYAVSVVALDPMAMEVAASKVARAIHAWRQCLASGTWPGYPRGTCYAEAPPWLIAQEESRAMMERARDDGRPIADQLFGEA